MKKGIGTEYRQKLAIVMKAAKGIITPKLVSKTLNLPTQESGRILSRWHQQGWVKRIKHGVYIPIAVDDMTGESSMEDSWILATHLFSPGYIAGFSAVKYWDFSEQLFETTTFFSTKKIKNRHPVIGNTRFQLKTISDYKIFGTQTVWRENTKTLVSDPTKTIADLFDDPCIVGGMRIVQDIFQAYKESNFFDLKKLIDYAEKMHNKTIFKRLGFLMENMEQYELIAEYDLLKKISTGDSLFDPTVKNTSTARRWNLKIPEAWKINND